jgi:hypothetical protein
MVAAMRAWREAGLGCVCLLCASCGERAKESRVSTAGDATAATSGAAVDGPGASALPSQELSSEPSHAVQSDARPDAGKLREVMRSMQKEPAESRQAFAGAALGEIGKGRLPEPLRQAFDELQSVPPDQRRLILLRALASLEVALAWTKVCPAGPRALAGMAALAPSEHGAYLVKICGLEHNGLVSSSEAAATDGTALAAALTADGSLGQGELERELLRFFVAASPARR